MFTRFVFGHCKNLALVALNSTVYKRPPLSIDLTAGRANTLTAFTVWAYKEGNEGGHVRATCPDGDADNPVNRADSNHG